MFLSEAVSVYICLFKEGELLLASMLARAAERRFGDTFWYEVDCQLRVWEKCKGAGQIGQR